MKCETCKRQLTKDKPVYRLFINVWERYRMVCAACEDQRAKRNTAKGLPTKYPPWRPARLCDHCSRPVVLDRLARKGLRYFVCGNTCRQAMQSATFRREHQRRRVSQHCADCSKPFAPTRADAKFCSAACKQRAHRQTHRKAVALGEATESGEAT
jgi:hypothetical protein